MNVRAYYAAPLVSSGGHALGTLCLLDQKPRTADLGTLELLSSLAADAAAVIGRERNALAYSEHAIAELCTRIRFAIGEQNDAEVAILDAELRRLEAKLNPQWQSGRSQ
ncbi:GAF domain-containing protein [Sphingomonas soli]|uniref:GAF domain-containing protein n=1 Tax=Sphingomonas soli TaxID=266127 RepID=UPI000ACFF39E